MRRDYFTLGLRNVEDTADGQPTVHVEYNGPSDAFETRLTPETAVDVAFRFQTPVDDSGASGVFSIADRMTGEFVLEVNADATEILTLIDAARAYGEATNDTDKGYSVLIERNGEQLFEAEKRTLLVYDQDGSLLRHHSLIPSGVEL
ncbi:DUF5793 family protein [Halorientalis brevis]|uniref:DUF5793 family protein n=1 Tax=Halorientalis brevis TaxID=1126241 RepID=A0ABD6CC57_9EURY|nr:DUF5793 family protein [Halorientalis brevis]